MADKRYKPMTHTIVIHPRSSYGGPVRRVPCRLTKRHVIVREYGLENGGLTFNRQTGMSVGAGVLSPTVELTSLEEIAEKT